MKYVLIIDVADDIAEDYEDFTVDYDFRGTPKENQMVNESIKYIEHAEPRPLPQKNRYNARIYATVDHENNLTLGDYLNKGWNECLDEITGETE